MNPIWIFERENTDGESVSVVFSPERVNPSTLQKGEYDIACAKKQGERYFASSEGCGTKETAARQIEAHFPPWALAEALAALWAFTPPGA